MMLFIILSTRAKICTIFHGMLRIEIVYTAFLIFNEFKTLEWSLLEKRRTLIFNRWFALYNEHENGTVDVVYVWRELSFWKRSVLFPLCSREQSRRTRECAMQEIDQVRDNAGNLL